VKKSISRAAAAAAVVVKKRSIGNIATEVVSYDFIIFYLFFFKT